MVLQNLKKIFFKSSSAEGEQAEEDFLSLENPNFVTDPNKIIRLLTDIETNSPLCSLQIDGAEQEYTSSILSVPTEQNCFLLDELNPKEGNAVFQYTKVAKVLIYYKGVRITFNVNDIEVAFARGITYYKCAMPDRIYYPQRRRAHRVEVPSLNIPFNGIAQKTGFSVNGYLYDLSRTGAGILMPVNKARLQRGDLIELCQISFDDYVMDFNMDVRFVKPGPVGSSKMQIGGMFENISSRSQTKLSHFVSSLERLEIRKQKA